jgi:predicted MFS family arabinose efflux permease
VEDATIGLGTLFGVAGAIAAKFAGVLADRGHARLQTGLFIAATAASFALLALGSTEVVALAVGVALLELGIQGTHITNQHEFYALRPDARSRLNTAYMTAYFAAGSAASGLSALFYDLWGWGAVCALGAVFPLAGLVVWLLDRTDAAPAVAAPRQVTAPS